METLKSWCVFPLQGDEEECHKMIHKAALISLVTLFVEKDVMKQ